MYSIAAATARWDALVEGGIGRAEGADGSFAAVMESKFESVFAGNAEASEALSRLGRRFPGATFREGRAEAGAQGMEELFGTEAGDHVAVDGVALEAMLGDGSLAKAVEDALSAFLEGGAASAPSSAYVQRRVTVTVTTVRFSVAQRDGETGDLLTDKELKTSLRDAIRGLIERFFGPEADKADAGEDAEDGETGQSGAPTHGGAFWSMELFYASSYIQAAGESNGGFLTAQTESFGARFSGGFSQLTDSFLPRAIFDGFSESGRGGPFTSLVGPALAGLGLSSDGVVRTAGGYGMKIRESRNLIAELMDLFSSRVLGAAATAVGGVETPAAGEVHSPEGEAEGLDAAAVSVDAGVQA